MSEKNSKLIWAVDAFAEDTDLVKKMGSFLSRWIAGTSIQIEPVYILSPSQTSLPTDVFFKMKKTGEEKAKEKLQSLLATAGIATLPPQLITSSDSSLRNAVGSLVAYAKSSGAELIAVGSNSRKLVSPYFFGSFAESLALFSEVPILMVTPKSVTPPNLKNLFFSTDLSEASREAFPKALDVAAKRKLEITVYNRVEYLAGYDWDLPNAEIEVHEHLKHDLNRRSAALRWFSEQAHQKGVKIKVVIDSERQNLTVAESILKAADKNHADFIAVSSQSGVATPKVLGSVARQVIRAANCPVWVLEPSIKIRGGEK